MLFSFNQVHRRIGNIRKNSKASMQKTEAKFQSRLGNLKHWRNKNFVMQMFGERLAASIASYDLGTLPLAYLKGG